jgi:hypothetical protein
MASSYEKEPIFLLERTWDNNTKLPKKYKFQGTNTGNKAEVHIDSGTLGMEFFLARTLPEFNQAGTRHLTGAGPSLSWNSRTYWVTDIAPPGSRSSPTPSLNPWKTSPKLLTSINAAIRRKTSIAQSPFSYVRYSEMQPAIHLHASGRLLSFSKGLDDPSLNAHKAIQGDASNCQSPISRQLVKALGSAST